MEISIQIFKPVTFGYSKRKDKSVQIMPVIAAIAGSIAGVNAQNNLLQDKFD